MSNSRQTNTHCANLFADNICEILDKAKNNAKINRDRINTLYGESPYKNINNIVTIHLETGEEILLCVRNIWYSQQAYQNISLDKVLDFISACRIINTLTQKKCVGLILSRYQVSLELTNNLERENINSSEHKICCISNQNENILLTEFEHFLHAHGIYLYEQDGNAYMLGC